MSDEVSRIHDYSLDIKNRIIYLTEEIDTDSYSRFVKNFIYLSCQVEPITIILTSIGGDVSCGLGIYDLILASTCQVSIVAPGEICSIATVIFQAGDLRLMSASSIMLIHSMSLILDGVDSVSDVKNKVLNSEKSYDLMLSIYASKMKKDINFIRDWIEKEKEIYLLPQEAVKLKLCDGVLGSRKYPNLTFYKDHD